MNGVPPLDVEIDRLYQLPLDEFTDARNALAKAAGKNGAKVRGLRKPPVAAWAINQVYWRERHVYASLIDAVQAMRAAHTAVLSGKQGDIRGAGRTHEAAHEAALEAALRVLAEAGHAVTDAAKQAIATTLRALPADEPPRPVDTHAPARRLRNARRHSGQSDIGREKGGPESAGERDHYPANGTKTHTGRDRSAGKSGRARQRDASCGDESRARRGADRAA